MEITSARLTYGLNARATSSQPNIFGDFQIGGNLLSFAPEIRKAYTITAFCKSGDSFNFNPVTSVATGTTFVPGSGMQEQQIGSDTATASGDIVVTITSAYTGTMVFSVPVTQGDTPEQWIDKIVAKANLTLVEYLPTFNLLRSGNSLYINSTPINVSANGKEVSFHGPDDPTLNLAIDGGSTGITSSPTSIRTATGTETLGVKIFGGDGNDFDGDPIGYITPLAMLVRTEKACAIDLIINGYNWLMPMNSTILLHLIPDETNWQLSPVDNGWVEVTVLGQ